MPNRHLSAECPRYLFSDCSREPAPPYPEKENASPAVTENEVNSKASSEGHKKECTHEKLSTIKITNANQLADNEESLSSIRSKGVAEGYAFKASYSDAGPIYRKLYDLTNDRTGHERSPKERLVCSLASTSAYWITDHKFTQKVYNIPVPRRQISLGHKVHIRSDELLRDLPVSRVAELEKDYFSYLPLKDWNKVYSKKIKLFEMTFTSELSLREASR